MRAEEGGKVKKQFGGGAFPGGGAFSGDSALPNDLVRIFLERNFATWGNVARNDAFCKKCALIFFGICFREG